MHSMHKTASLRHLFLAKDLFISTLEVFFICNFEFQYETGTTMRPLDATFIRND